VKLFRPVGLFLAQRGASPNDRQPGWCRCCQRKRQDRADACRPYFAIRCPIGLLLGRRELPVWNVQSFRFGVHPRRSRVL